MDENYQSFQENMPPSFSSKISQLLSHNFYSVPGTIVSLLSTASAFFKSRKPIANAIKQSLDCLLV
jgi:hypothetical protein